MTNQRTLFVAGQVAAEKMGIRLLNLSRSGKTIHSPSVEELTVKYSALYDKVEEALDELGHDV
jgi:hypothetical protein